MIDIKDYGLEPSNIKHQEDKILFLDTGGVYCACSGKCLTLVRGQTYFLNPANRSTNGRPIRGRFTHGPPIWCPECKEELTKKTVTAAFVYGYRILSKEYMDNNSLRIYGRGWRI